MRLLSRNILGWKRSHPAPSEFNDAQFMVHGEDTGGKFSVDVLGLTGPAMVGEALQQYHGTGSLRGVREGFGEKGEDESSWAMVSIVKPGNSNSNSNESQGSSDDVVVLPYCFFRSRGCKHIQEAFRDTVIFHHEFDTSWRPTFWHNYYREVPNVASNEQLRYGPGC